MGKTSRRESRPPRRESSELVSNPFKEGLKDVKVKPWKPCLVCGEPVDGRLTWSLANPRGSHRGQPQGWMHEDCLTVEGKKRFEETWAPGEKEGVFLKTVVKNLGVEVPVSFASEDDVQDFLNSRKTNS